MPDTRLTPPEAPSQAADAGDSIDLQAYWRTIVRRRWFLIPFFAVTVLVTAVVTLRMTKIYDATCTIIIDLAAPKVLDKDSVQDVVESGSGSYWFSKEYYETQYEVLTGRAVAQRVVDRACAWRRRRASRRSKGRQRACRSVLAGCPEPPAG